MDEINGIRVGLAERRNTDARDYKILMNVAGDTLEYALRPAELRRVAGTLVAGLFGDGTVDDLVVVGLAPGGIPLALAVGYEIDAPVVIAYKCRLGEAHEVTWTEPHSVNATFYLYGLAPGSRVVVVDDEVDTGRTIVNAVRSMRAAGIDVLAVGCGVESLHDEVSAGRRRLADEGLDLVSVRRLHIDQPAESRPVGEAAPSPHPPTPEVIR